MTDRNEYQSKVEVREALEKEYQQMDTLRQMAVELARLSGEEGFERVTSVSMRLGYNSISITSTVKRIRVIRVR